MKTLLICLLLVCSLGFAQAQAPSATPPSPADQDARTRIILDVTRVNLLFTVTDKRGRFVTNLGKDDFSVREGKNEQKILEFVSESDL
ncbi:MAG: VWA domain-containing protein, partial [Acidobacteriales bacterium]